MYQSRILRRDVAVALLLTATVIPAALQGTGARADSDTGTVTATVTVTGELTLAFTDAAIALSGTPGQLVEDLDTVAFTVTTNNPTGYNITVDPDQDVLTGTIPPNPTIPATALEVRDQTAGNTTPDYVALTLGPLTIHNQITASAPTGDAITNDYRITVPSGTPPNSYTGTITYIATDNAP